MAASFNLTGCSAVGSALRSGRRGRAFESPHPDQKPRKELDFSLLRGFCNFSRDRNETAARIEVCLDHRDAPCTEMLYGPRTSTFCNPLRHNAMQNNPVRGPLKKAGTTNNDFLQVTESQLNTKFACSRSVVSPFFSRLFAALRRTEKRLQCLSTVQPQHCVTFYNIVCIMNCRHSFSPDADTMQIATRLRSGSEYGFSVSPL